MTAGRIRQIFKLPPACGKLGHIPDYDQMIGKQSPGSEPSLAIATAAILEATLVFFQTQAKRNLCAAAGKFAAGKVPPRFIRRLFRPARGCVRPDRVFRQHPAGRNHS